MKNYTITVNGTAYQVTVEKDLQAQQHRLQQQLQHRQQLGSSSSTGSRRRNHHIPDAR